MSGSEDGRTGARGEGVEPRVSAYKFIVLGNSAEGREDEYNKWHTRHIQDVIAVPGFRSGQRFQAVAAVGDSIRYKYLALFEVETADPEALLGDLLRRVEAGTLGSSDAMDKDRLAAFYQPITLVMTARDD